jgi:hypothetical protein
MPDHVDRIVQAWRGSETWTSTRTSPRSAPPAAPGVMAALHNLAITILRLTGATSIAAALRYHARRQLTPTDDHELLNDYAGALG